MLLGHPLPAPYSAWRVVEGDLYDIAGRVREYDPDARLVANDETGQLGLGVINQHSGRMQLAREMFDSKTDRPLVGTPDGRVLRCQIAYDSRRFRDIRTWQRMVREAYHAGEERNDRATEETLAPLSEQYVHAYGKDIGFKGRAFIPDRERAVA